MVRLFNLARDCLVLLRQKRLRVRRLKLEISRRIKQHYYHVEVFIRTFKAGTVNENHVLKRLDLQVEEETISVIGKWSWEINLMNILVGNLIVDEGGYLARR